MIFPSDGQLKARTVVSVPGWPEAARNSRLKAARVIPSSKVLSKPWIKMRRLRPALDKVAGHIRGKCALVRVLNGGDRPLLIGLNIHPVHKGRAVHHVRRYGWRLNI